MKHRLIHKLRHFLRDSEGATLLELTIIVPLLLLLVFGVIEFGRFGYNETMAQKATDLAVRTAAVRPSACDGVSGEIVLPDTYQPPENTGTTPPRFGTLCRFDTAGNPTCATVPPQTCSLQDAIAIGNATAIEIWQTIEPLVPANATPDNIEISYTFDGELGFLGGPYTPIVTAEIINLEFQFVSPLGALAALAGADGEGVANSINFPSMSASLPAEDLGQGVGG